MAYVLNWGCSSTSNIPQFALIFHSLNLTNGLPDVAFSLNWNFPFIDNCPLQILFSVVWNIPTDNILPTIVASINLIFPTTNSSIQLVISINWYFPTNETMPEIVFSLNFTFSPLNSTPIIIICYKWTYPELSYGTQIVILI